VCRVKKGGEREEGVKRTGVEDQDSCATFVTRQRTGFFLMEHIQCNLSHARRPGHPASNTKHYDDKVVANFTTERTRTLHTGNFT